MAKHSTLGTSSLNGSLNIYDMYDNDLALDNDLYGENILTKEYTIKGAGVAALIVVGITAAGTIAYLAYKSIKAHEDGHKKGYDEASAIYEKKNLMDKRNCQMNVDALLKILEKNGIEIDEYIQ